MVAVRGPFLSHDKRLWGLHLRLFYESVKAGGAIVAPNQSICDWLRASSAELCSFVIGVTA